MRAILERQLRVPLFVGFFALTSSFLFAASPEPREQAIRELQAARLMEATIVDRGPSAEDLHKLEEIYSQLSNRFPADSNIRNAQAEFLWQCGKYERAESIWRDIEKLEPNNSATLRSLGNAALAGGEIRQAADYLTRASASQPASALYHFELANVLFLFRKDLAAPPTSSVESVIDQALKHYAEACRLAPSNIDFARGYAETFYGVPKPDWNSALAAWNHLLEISPQKDFALANLATVYLKLGNKDLARSHVAQMQSPEFASRKKRLMERIEKE